jgi:hypothetical protein
MNIYIYIYILGAIIIQPINYKYDHSYLINVMKDVQFKELYKFVCLFNPTFETINEGNIYLENLHSQGFVGMLVIKTFCFCMYILTSVFFTCCI